MNTLTYIDRFYGPPMDVMSTCLRAMITAAPGNDLIAIDFSAIEARVIAWLAGEQHVLDTFESGEDIYLAAAKRINASRAVGKVATLALGYQGGVGAFQKMSYSYDVSITDDEAEDIKVAWRNHHPAIVAFWTNMNTAAMNAVYEPGKTLTAGRYISYRVAGSFLWCQLPSKRVLCYPYPSIVDKEVPWGGTQPALQYKGVDPITRKWGEIDTYGGKLSENVTQAVARDILAEAMFRLEAADYPIVMHVHDEAVCEIAEDFGSLEEATTVFSEVPKWAEGLPLDATGWRGKRYRK